jgi:hypothetical protein
MPDDLNRIEIIQKDAVRIQLMGLPLPRYLCDE